MIGLPSPGTFRRLRRCSLPDYALQVCKTVINAGHENGGTSPNWPRNHRGRTTPVNGNPEPNGTAALPSLAWQPRQRI